MSEIYLEDERTRIVGPFDIAPGKESDPTVRFDPDEGSLTVDGGGARDDGRIRLKNEQGTETVTLSAEDGTGSLELADGSGTPAITLNAAKAGRPKIEVTNGSDPTASLEPGRLSLFYTGPEGGDPPLKTNGKGLLTLATVRGRTTCTFDGREAALVLSTAPETETGDEGEKLERYGGGELVLQSADRTDLQVHAQGERESSYGADVDNWPRIHLDGPEAMLELGRHRIDGDRPAENGEIHLRDDGGHPVLRARATEDDDSEILFEWVDGGESKHRGAIRSHPEGLAIHDAGGHEALRLTGSGKLKTRKEVTENAEL